jgi:hypothetical protein
VRRAVDVVHEDRPADTDFVAQQLGVGELGLERDVMTDVLAGMRLTGVDEYPVDLGTPLGGFAQQRTLC